MEDMDSEMSPLHSEELRTPTLKSGLKTILCKLGQVYLSLNTNICFSVVFLLFIVAVTVTVVVISVLLFPVRIDFSLRSFEVPNHVSSQRLDTFQAMKEDIENSISDDGDSKPRVRREENVVTLRTQQVKKWKLDVVYMPYNGNVFTAENLKVIHKIEEALLRNSEYQSFCWRSYIASKDPLLQRDFNGCSPPNSLLGYFFRTNFYDGLGKTLSDIPGTLDYLLSRSSTFWYVDEQFSSRNRRSRLLRSQLYFGVPLRGFEHDASLSSLEAQHERFKSFIVHFVERLEASSTKKIRILYGSPEIYDHQVKSTFRNDLLLAVSSFILIFLLVFFLSSFSLWLMFCGIMFIVLSVPLAYFIYRVCLNMQTVGILTGASIFVIIGIGVDDVFVFINLYRQFSHVGNEQEKMRKTVVTAGKATFFTSFTTAAAFGANVMSQIPAVHDFGLYSCIVVMACWLIVMFGMPPSLTIWMHFFRRCEDKVWFCKCCRKNQAFGGEHTCEQLLDSGDLGITMDTITDDGEAGEEDCPQDAVVTGDLLYLGSGNLGSFRTEIASNSNLASLLQGSIKKWIGVPVIKGRFFVIALFLTGIAVSAYYCSRLSTAKDRPQLFPSDSNLQQLLNLRYNLSAEDFDCTTCSGMYNEYISSNTPKDQSHVSTVSLGGKYQNKWKEYYRVKGKNAGWMPSFLPAIFTAKKPNEIQDYLLKTTTVSIFGNLSTPSGIKVKQIHSKHAVLVRRGSSNAATEAAHSAAKPTAPSRNSSHLDMLAANTMVSSSEDVLRRKGRKPLLISGGPSFVGTEIPLRDLKNEQKRGKFGHDLDKVVTSSPFMVNSPRRQPLPNTTASIPPMDSRSSVAPSGDLLSKERQSRRLDVFSTKNPLFSVKMKTEDPKERKLCPTPGSCVPAVRPILDKTALVFVVFGLKGVDRKLVSHQHVLTGKGIPIYDSSFVIKGEDFFAGGAGKLLSALCKVCNMIEGNRQLVQRGGADCFPDRIYSLLKFRTPYPECRRLRLPSHVKGKTSLGILSYRDGEVKAIAMAFESTTPRGKPAFEALKDYQNWEKFISKVLSDADVSAVPGLRSGFQTSTAWVKMFSEVTAVNGAIYGSVLSITMCFAAVVVFTGNAALTCVVCSSIFGILCVVLALFYLTGWELGAVEAVSLSILVGTSVDYIVHLVEGYLFSGKEKNFRGFSNKEVRTLRTQAALSHIGVSILSSAVTTLMASIPLCFAQIRLFAKFGQILAMNTGISVIFTFTVCVALLATVGPVRYCGSLKSRMTAGIVTTILVAASILALYLLNRFGHVNIPGPNGGPLF